MTKITAILVDDEISNIKGLQKKLASLFPKIEIMATFQKPEDAICALTKQQPDILFLDIQMPRINGFELLASLQEIDFQIIFVTAYNEYAIDAFKESAVDYILKPIANEDLTIAVQKAVDIIIKHKQHQTNEQLVQLLTKSSIENNKIMVPTLKGISFIPQEELFHLEGYDGYTKLHLLDGSVVSSSYNLGKFQKLLNTQFFKCHKSHIINLSKVRSFENEGYIVLENEERIPISKANKKAFLNLFK